MFANKARFVWMRAEEDRAIVENSELFWKGWYFYHNTTNRPALFRWECGALFQGQTLIAVAAWDVDIDEFAFVYGETWANGRDFGRAVQHEMENTAKLELDVSIRP
jgi:hypothetical protein